VAQGNRAAGPDAARLRPAAPTGPDQVPVDGPVEGWAGLDTLDPGRPADPDLADSPDPGTKPETSSEPDSSTKPDSSTTPETSAKPSTISDSPASPDNSKPAPRGPGAGRHATPKRPLQVRLRHGLRVTSRALAGWPQRPAGQLAVPGLLIVVLMSASVVLGALLVPKLPTRPHHAFAMIDPSAPDTGAAGLPGGENGETQGGDQNGAGGQIPPDPSAQHSASSTKPSDLAAWAAPLATKLGIPLPAMQAYGYAELAVSAAEPACQLHWTTLAGIGKVESSHGQDHATLSPDGKALPPIIGAPLDGLAGRAAVPDTDGGKIDGDRTWDRAVGPMQFIPSTWNKYAADADGDQVSDINDIDDAALAAARYLCDGNRNLSLAGEWWAAILSYNAVQQYAQDVFNAANDYGVRSR
jgi:Transglycosylase SLT domain